MRVFLFVFFSLFLGRAEVKEGVPQVIAVGEAEVVRETLLIAPVKKGVGLKAPDLSFAKSFHEQLWGNFAFYQKIFHLSQNPKKSSRYEIRPSLARVGSILQLGVVVYDNVLEGGGKKEIYSEKIPSHLPQGQKSRDLIHALSDRIYRALTGRQSIFTSKIAFVSDFASRGKTVFKELYIMDFDGRHKRRLTWHRGVVVSPAISAQKDMIVYSLIQRYRGLKKKNQLRLYDLKNKKDRILSFSEGMNSGAVFFRDGKSLLLTMSYQGNPEIYRMEIESKKLTRITRRWAGDLDPSLNAREDRMAFLSGRSGAPMIYVADTDGQEKNVKRVSFVGKFNATPRFSPNGQEIVFSSWVDNRFDLYRINADGQQLTRLTRNFGSNESPSYSLDGEFIVFSSQRVISKKRADQNLYIMSRNGEILGNLTKNFGKCTFPRWSK